MRILFVPTADWHCNSVVGLCPPGFKRDSGQGVVLSKPQEALWEGWLGYKTVIQQVRFRLKPDKTWGAADGDSCDMNTHDGAGLCSHVRSDVPKMATQTYAPWAEMFDRFWVIRGTEAHGGGQGELEETFATQIGAVPDAVLDHNSWWHLKLDIAGVKFSVAHHPATAGYLPYTRRPAVLRLANIEAWSYEDNQDELPDVILRAHTHAYNRTPVGMRPMVVQLPAWQLGTSYMHRKGSYQNVPVGGCWFLCEDGRVVDYDVELYWPERRGYWTEC